MKPFELMQAIVELLPDQRLLTRIELYRLTPSEALIVQFLDTLDGCQPLPDQVKKMARMLESSVPLAVQRRAMLNTNDN